MKRFFRTFVLVFLTIFFINQLSVFAADGSEIYKQRCNRCHGPKGDGKGDIGKFMNPPPGDFKIGLKNLSDEQIEDAIKNGKGGSPAFKNTLSEDEIEAMIRYIKGLAK
jgi:mono/diheme cytochrome c family protein